MADRLPRKLAAILYADVAGYSRLTEADEDTTHRTLSEYLNIISSVIESHNGQVTNYAGDAVLAKFDAVADAMSAAVGIQVQLKSRNEAVPDERKVQFRIGVNLGDVIEDRGDIYGDGVNIAARLESLAAPGGICISDVVRSAVRKKLDLVFEDMGEQQVKNISEPVRTYKIVMESREAPATIESVKPAREFPGKPSIAVLAFENMSGDTEQEFLADGISEDLITALSKIRWFLVIDRNSSFSYKGKALKIAQIAEELGVRYVLEGSVRKSLKRVRITAQLVDTTTGSNIWAERYDRDIEDIFALQDEMALTIVSAVDAEIGAAERGRALRKPPDNLDTWETYQRGLWHLWRFYPEDISEAIRLFRSAYKLDPGFAPAFAYEGYAHYVNVTLGYVDDIEGNLDKAMKASRKAVSLDPRDAVAHFALGRVYTMRGEHKAAISSLRESVFLNPSLAQAHHGLGWALLLSGEVENAIKGLLTAIQLSPRGPHVWATMVFLSLANCLKKRYEKAAEWALTAAQVPTDAGYWSSATLAAALAKMDRKKEAQDALEKALRQKPDLTLSYLKRTLPVKEPKILEPYLEGLRLAGLPD